MLNQFDNFIFDLDGTILNSSQEILKCLKSAFNKVKYQINENNLSPAVIGPPLKDIIKLIAPNLDDENKISEIIKNFRDIYDDDLSDVSTLYSGIYKFLIESKKQNKKLFLATLKPYKPTLRLIKQFKLDFFEDIYSIDKFERNLSKKEMITEIIKKYNLNKEKTIMFGDTLKDITAAKECEIRSIGVTWGYETDKLNFAKHADYIINDINEIQGI